MNDCKKVVLIILYATLRFSFKSASMNSALHLWEYLIWNYGDKTAREWSKIAQQNRTINLGTDVRRIIFLANNFVFYREVNFTCDLQNHEKLCQKDSVCNYSQRDVLRLWLIQKWPSVWDTRISQRNIKTINFIWISSRPKANTKCIRRSSL